VDAHIRYLAIVSERPETLAHFYMTYFSMRELGRSDEGDIALTDGFYNVSLVKPRPGADEIGISHFGIEIDDVREIEARLEEFAPKSDIQQEEGGLFHGEYRVFDPNGVAVSLSERHFNLPAAERHMPNIRHMAMCVPNNDRVLDYYRNVFGFREPGNSRKLREAGLPVRWAADGSTAMAILTSHKGRVVNEETESSRDGVNHFGFLVKDMDSYLTSLPKGAISERDYNVAPGVPRSSAEFRVFDPDRNPFDLSETKGYEVDVDVFARA